MALSWRDQARLRGNAFHQRGTCALAMRIITMAIPTIAQLGLPPVVADLTDKPHGLILVTGAPGSGKSTSLDAMVDHINSLRASRRAEVAPSSFRSMPSAWA